MKVNITILVVVVFVRDLIHNSVKELQNNTVCKDILVFLIKNASRHNVNGKEVCIFNVDK